MNLYQSAVQHVFQKAIIQLNLYSNIYSDHLGVNIFFKFFFFKHLILGIGDKVLILSNFPLFCLHFVYNQTFLFSKTFCLRRFLTAPEK